MIRVKMYGGRIVSDKLPVVGEMILVEHFGNALVQTLTHADLINFIQLELQKTLQGKVSLKFPFEVKG